MCLVGRYTLLNQSIVCLTNVGCWNLTIALSLKLAESVRNRFLAWSVHQELSFFLLWYTLHVCGTSAPFSHCCENRLHACSLSASIGHA